MWRNKARAWKLSPSSSSSSSSPSSLNQSKINTNQSENKQFQTYKGDNSHSCWIYYHFGVFGRGFLTGGAFGANLTYIYTHIYIYVGNQNRSVRFWNWLEWKIVVATFLLRVRVEEGDDGSASMKWVGKGEKRG